MTEKTRRDLLRAGAVTAGGLAAVGASIDRVQGRRMTGIDPATGEPIAYQYEFEAERHAESVGLSRHNTTQLTDGSYAVQSRESLIGKYGMTTSHPSVRGFNYLGTVSVGDLCLWTGLACSTYGVYLVAHPEPVSSGAVATLCPSVGMGCGLHEVVNRETDCEWSHLHIYRAKWWNVFAHAAGGTHIVVPETNC